MELQQLMANFEYVSDHRFWDSWRILKADKDGKFRGDCDDFAVTALYCKCGGSMVDFWKELIIGKAKIVYCTGANDFRHAVLRYDDMYIDNIVKAWTTKEGLEQRGYVLHRWLFPWPMSVLKMCFGLIR